MKKTYVQYNENGNVEAYAYGSGAERIELYAGVDQLYGEWMLRADYVVTLNTLEDEGAEDMIAAINEILASGSTCWEDLSEEDAEYIEDYLKECGIEEDKK